MSYQRKLEKALEELDTSEEFGYEFARRDGAWGASPVLKFEGEEMVLRYIAGSDSDGFIVFQVDGDESGSYYQLTFLQLYSRFAWLSSVDRVEPRTETVYELID